MARGRGPSRPHGHPHWRGLDRGRRLPRPRHPPCRTDLRGRPRRRDPDVPGDVCAARRRGARLFGVDAAGPRRAAPQGLRAPGLQLVVPGSGASRRCGRSSTRPRRGRRTPASADGTVVRVLIVDDQALVRAGFRMILEAEDGHRGRRRGGGRRGGRRRGAPAPPARRAHGRAHAGAGRHRGDAPPARPTRAPTRRWSC